MTTQTLPPGVEELGRLACECELWAQQREMSVRDRHDLMKRAQAYRDEQFRLLSLSSNEYPYEMILEPGPNTSELPDEDTGNAIVGAVWGFILLALLGSACAAVWVLWRCWSGN